MWLVKAEFYKKQQIFKVNSGETIMDNYSNLMIKPINSNILWVKGMNTHPFFCLLPKKKMSIRQLESTVHAKEVKLSATYTCDKRKLEFLRSRYGLRSIMGQKVAPILKNKRGAPKWPVGWLGSLSHKEGVVVFLVKKQRTEFVSLGIDIEAFAVNDKIVERISSQKEIYLYKKTLEEHSFLGKGFLNTLFFSIKEAMYKCVDPFIQSKQLCLSACHIEKLNLKNNTLQCSVVSGNHSVTNIQGWFQPVYLKDHAPYLVTGCMYEGKD